MKFTIHINLKTTVLLQNAIPTSRKSYICFKLRVQSDSVPVPMVMLRLLFVALLRSTSATPQQVWQSPKLHGVASTPSLDPEGKLLYVPFELPSPFSDAVGNATDETLGIPPPVISILIDWYLCC